ncbi:DUF1566 domain-containing protein [Thalassotalea psychrophila]|uniref:DUF1566 domain-containing protein n=1 Tax=Thalassotalea psychrophila TaxID=3065647 RepID=A0ABY9TYI4_9GAMM|nr:DUF1566 domain-containing protein [Colwelliaceae bacterium SQ149]
MRNHVTLALVLLLSACGGGASNSKPETAQTTKAPEFEIVGSQSINEQQPVQLKAQVSYPSNPDSLTIEWSQPNEQNIALSTDKFNASFTSPDILLAEGQRVLKFTATITDTETQKSTSDDISITVNALDISPQVNVDNFSVAENTTAILSAETLGNGDESILYAWSALDESGIEIMDADQQKASFIAPDVIAPTPFAFSVTATDNEGSTTTTKIIVTVNPVISGYIALGAKLPLAEATIAVNSITGGSWLILGKNKTNADGEFSIEVPFSLRNGFAITSTSGKVNSQTFDSNLTNICFSEDKTSCYASPLTSLITKVMKAKIKHGLNATKVTKELTINSLYDALGVFSLSHDPFMNKIARYDFNTTKVISELAIVSLNDWLNGVAKFINQQDGYSLETVSEYFPYADDERIASKVSIEYNDNSINHIARLTEKRTINLLGDIQSYGINNTTVEVADKSYEWSLSNAENIEYIELATPTEPTSLLTLGSVDEDRLIDINLTTTLTTTTGIVYTDTVTQTFTILNNLTSENTPPEISLTADQIFIASEVATLYAKVEDFEDDLSTYDNKNTRYHWQQVFVSPKEGEALTPTSDIPVLLSNETTLSPTFTAPDVEFTTELLFLLTVTDSGNDNNEGSIKNTALISAFILPKLSLAPVALNDTGITLCANYAFDGSRSHNNKVPCDDQGHIDEIPAEQDAHIGRDADQFENIAEDGYAGFSFTKLDSQGQELAHNAQAWSCVQDNVTGLIWEVKTNSTSTDDIHGRQHTANWRNTDHFTNGGSHLDTLINPEKFAGIEDDASCTTSQNICLNTEEVVNKVNTESKLCGFSDWRLPSRVELHSLVDYGKTTPMIDTRFFPYTSESMFYLTADTNPIPGFATDGSGVYTWLVSFRTGELVSIKKRYAKMKFRLVRTVSEK